MELFNSNFCLELSTIKVFCKIYKKKFAKWDQVVVNQPVVHVYSLVLYQTWGTCSPPASLLSRSGFMWFFPSPEIESLLKGRRFVTIDDVKINSAKAFQDISKVFQDYFVKWKHSWEKCVNKGGGCTLKGTRICKLDNKN